MIRHKDREPTVLQPWWNILKTGSTDGKTTEARMAGTVGSLSATAQFLLNYRFMFRQPNKQLPLHSLTSLQNSGSVNKS